VTAGMSPLAHRMRSAAHRVEVRLRRAGPASLGVRVGVLLFGAVALLVALPAAVSGRPVAALLCLVVAAGPAIWPGNAWPTAIEAAAVGAWLASGLLYHQTPSVPATAALAVLLYAHHTAAALADAVPLDTRLAPAVLLGWLARTGGVLLVTLLLGVVLWLLLPSLGGGAALAVLGVLAATATGVLMAFLLHRRT
jgi:hypothetical protein